MRSILEKGTLLRVAGGVYYEIIGEPIGEGGAGIIYPAKRYLADGGADASASSLLYALKECYPVSSKYSFTRNPYGEIVPIDSTKAAGQYLDRIKRQQLAENEITRSIYNTGFRLTPVLESFSDLEISMDQGETFHPVHNLVSVMESLSSKGKPVKNYLRERKYLTVDLTFRIIEQALYAVREVHEAGYLHLDIQDGNVFIRGRLDDNSGLVSLLDFGTARKRETDGLCAAIRNQALYSTPGFSAPELLYGNDGTLRLGPEADIYSIGCLMRMMLGGSRSFVKERRHHAANPELPRFSLRKTRCPGHLIKRLQGILVKALADAPKNRYHSTDEMLKDVQEFLLLLAPYQNPLSGMKYDAFICYRHGEMDTLAANELRNALERYREGLFQRHGTIQRVFLDQGELAACADFGERIREALKNSNWLIVLCSEKTRESRWVEEEIRTFLEFHPPSHILAVVIAGEPGEVYPVALRKAGLDADKLLAADARGKNKHELIKKIRGDARLKIAAPILNTTFDELKQRRRLYEVRRIALLVCTAFLIITLFFGFAMVKSRQMAVQAEEIAVQKDIALKNQAKYLLNQAEQSFDANDRAASVEQCLQAYDLLKDSGDILPEIYDLLSENLGLYSLPSEASETMTPQGVCRLKGDSVCEKYFTDSRGESLFTAADDTICLWDTASFQNKQTIEAPEPIVQFDEGCLLGNSGDILAVSRHSIICYDYKTGKIVWEFDGNGISAVSVSEDESLIAAADEEKLYLLEAKTGKLRKATEPKSTEPKSTEPKTTEPKVTEVKTTGTEASMPKENGESGLTQATEYTFSDSAICISPDGRQIVCTVSKSMPTEEGSVCELQVYDVISDEWHLLSQLCDDDSYGSSDVFLKFTADGGLLFLHRSGQNIVLVDQVYRFVSNKLNLDAALFDLENKEQVWKNERQYQSVEGPVYALEIPYKGENALFIAYGNRGEVLDAKNGNLLDFCDTDATIETVWDEEASIALALENGDLLHFSYADGNVEGYKYFPGRLRFCYRNSSDYYIRLRRQSSFQLEKQIMKYRYEMFDNRYETCRIPDDESSHGLNSGIWAITRGETASGDGMYVAKIKDSAVVLRKKGDRKEKELPFEDTPISLYFLSDSSGLLIGFSDKAVRYSMDSGTLTESRTFRHTLSTVPGTSGWQEMDKETAVFSDGIYAYVLHLPEASFGVECELKHLYNYNPQDRCFYFKEQSWNLMEDQSISWGPEETGKIKRYTEKEIVGMAREFLFH